MPSAPLLRPSALARFWELNPRTLPEWIKAGRLVAIRSPGGHYRVRPSDVRDFCAREGLRVPPFAREDATRVVLAGIAATGERAVEKAVAGKSVGLASFASAMEGIVAAAREPPTVLAIDASSREIAVDAAIRALRGVRGFEAVVVIAFNAESQSQADAPVRAGATRALVKKGPTTLAKEIAERIG